MAPRKRAKGKKPPETMRQRQMRLRRLAAAKKNAGKKLPAKGKSTANSAKAVTQRGITRDRLAKKNLNTFIKGVKRMIEDDARSSRRAKKVETQKKGLKSSGKVTTPKYNKGGPIKKVQSTKDALSRKRLGNIKQTKARVGSVGLGPKKSSTAAIVKSPKGSSALAKNDSGKRGRSAAKARAAAKGTKGSGVKVAGGKGLPKQTPQLPPASKLKAAGRAIGKVAKPVAPGLKGIGRVAGPLGYLVEGVSTASDLADSLKRGEGIVRLLKGVKDAPKAKVSRTNRGKTTAKRAKTKSTKSQHTSRKVGPKATEGGYTISKKNRQPARRKTTSSGVPTSKSSAPHKTQRQREGAEVRRQYDDLRKKHERGEISQAEFARRGMQMHKKYFGKS